MSRNKEASISDKNATIKLENRDIVLNMNRRILAYEMMLSANQIPHVCFSYEPEVSAFLDYFKKFKAAHNLSITFNTLMLRVVAEGMKASPILNSHLKYNFRSAKGTLHTFEKIDINMPAILPSGAMQALNVRDVGSGSLVDLDNKVKDLLAKTEDEIAFTQAQFALAMEQTIGQLKRLKLFSFFSRVFGAYFGKERIQLNGCKNHFQYLRLCHKHNKTIDKSKMITKDEIREGTVIVSNVGSLNRNLKGTTQFFEILPPQIFAVMVGNFQKKAIVKKNEDGTDEIAVGTILPLTLAFDHRACDFDALLPFMKRLDEIFADPSIIESWL